jgi:hypothetical protein
MTEPTVNPAGTILLQIEQTPPQPVSPAQGDTERELDNGTQQPDDVGSE